MKHCRTFFEVLCVAPHALVIGRRATFSFLSIFPPSEFQNVWSCRSHLSPASLSPQRANKRVLASATAGCLRAAGWKRMVMIRCLTHLLVIRMRVAPYSELGCESLELGSMQRSRWAYTTGQQLKLWLQGTGAFNWISVLFPFDKQRSESISDCAAPPPLVAVCCASRC